ncbi:MAG TPA: outer membrane beta-barrel protein [Mucilaginibacter sp.]|jgi:hypothetical protein
MKRTLLTLISFFLVTQLFAQKFEISVQANSGLYHYGGKSSASVSSIIQGASDKDNYTNNPYGNKNGFSYGVAVQGQYVAKSGLIIGLQAGYDLLRSKVDINIYYPQYVYLDYTSYFAPPQTPVTGQTFLQNQDINLNPYIGYRIKTSKIKIDIMPGIDLGFNVSSYDKGKATDNSGNVYRTDLKLQDAPTDLRLKLGVSASYKNFGIMAAYAHGLTNLGKNMISNNGFEVASYSGGGYELHSELIWFGVTYRIL